MTPESILSIGQQALWVTFAVSSPLLLSALAVGLIIGMLQAATQINEMTLSFIPKLLVLGLSVMVAGPSTSSFGMNDSRARAASE